MEAGAGVVVAEGAGVVVAARVVVAAGAGVGVAAGAGVVVAAGACQSLDKTTLVTCSTRDSFEKKSNIRTLFLSV